MYNCTSFVVLEGVMAIKSYSIRIDEELLHKLHIVASYELRSANSEIIVLIREAIERFEKEHGKIDFTL